MGDSDFEEENIGEFIPVGNVDQPVIPSTARGADLLRKKATRRVKERMKRLNAAAAATRGASEGGSAGAVRGGEEGGGEGGAVDVASREPAVIHIPEGLRSPAVGGRGGAAAAAARARALDENRGNQSDQI